MDTLFANGSQCIDGVVPEIRICWNVAGRTSKGGDPIDAGHWHPDSTGNREMLQIILDSGNAIHGDGSHWVEVRGYHLSQDQA